MELPKLTEQEREQILTDLHQRRFLEEKALKEEAEAQKAEAQRQHNAAIALELAQKQEERKNQLITELSYSHQKISEALEALQEGDESKCYRLLAQGIPNLSLVQQRLTQKPTITGISAGVPTVRVKRPTPLGYAIVNAEDVTPADEILEDAE